MSSRPFSLESLFRTIHSWLGIFVLPLIIMIGLTGIYLNHPNEIYPLIPNGTYDEAQMDLWQEPTSVDEDAARAIANTIWPAEGIKSTTDAPYHNRDAFTFKKGSGSIIVAKATGHYWVKTRKTRVTYDPNGTVVNTKRYWDNIFKTLHTRGWIDSTLGTWLADIAAGAMVVFGLTGFYMFFAPKLRRRGNKKVQLGGHQARDTPRPKRVRIKK